MPHSVGFFVCGTPSNNDGFQFVELGPAKLPGSPRTYLDRPVNDATESYRFEPVSIDGGRYLLYGRAVRINPYDSAANRGAYLAVGCLAGGPLPMHTVANCIDIVSEVYGNVTALLKADRTLPLGYRLAQYAYSGIPLDERLEHQCSPLLLADVMMQGLSSEGTIDWHAAKPFSFAPAELLAADIRRYQLYTAQGTLGSLVSLDERRAEIDESVRQTVAAAGVANELQAEWGSFIKLLDGGIDGLAEKASAFRRVIDDIERVAQRNQKLQPGPLAARSPFADAGAEADPSGSRQPPGSHEWPARTQMPVRAVRTHGSARRRSGHGRRVFGVRMRPETWVYALAGTAAAVALGLVLRVWLLRDVPTNEARDALELPAEVQPLPPSGDPEHPTPEPRRSDVASERAALDDAPDATRVHPEAPPR
jgi:hypothetical protein